MLDFKKKNLVICPTCELQGFKSILGELGTTGEFIVQRFHQGETIIKSPAYMVLCGRCGGTNYVHQGTIFDQGPWLHFEQTTVAFAGSYITA